VDASVGMGGTESTGDVLDGCTSGLATKGMVVTVI
jgi:hypothetical protein